MRKTQMFSLLAAVACLLFADMAMAQPGRGRGGSPFGGGSSVIDLMRMESVQAEIEASEAQIERFQELAEEMAEEQREYFSGLREKIQGMSDDERREMFQQLQTDVGELRKRFDDMAKEELLPVQLDRVKQLVFQRQNQRSGEGQLSSGLAEELGVTEDQIELLRDKAAEIRPELEKKIAKLRAQATEEILSSVLDADQMARYKELVGDSFNFGGGDRRGGFGGGFQRGGGDRGGDRGRGGPGGGRGGDRGERGSDF